MKKKKVFTWGIATSVWVLLAATVLPSGLAFADSLEEQAPTVTSQVEVTSDTSSEEAVQLECEENQSTASATTNTSDSADQITTTTSDQEDSTTDSVEAATNQEGTKETSPTIDLSTESSELLAHDESAQATSSAPSTKMSSTGTEESRKEPKQERAATEMQTETVRRKRAPLIETAPIVDPLEELPLAAPFDVEAFDAAIDTYIDNANEEELGFVVNAGNESEMQEALEYLLLNQIEEEYGIEQLEELKSYLTAEEIALIENEPSVEKFEALLTKFYDEREQNLEAASFFSDFFLASTDEEIDQMLQAKDEQELAEVLTVLSEKREEKNQTASDRNKRFAPLAFPLAIPLIKGAIWLAGIGITAYTGHQTYQALEKQRAEKKRMVQRWKAHEQQANARQQAAQRAKAQAVARARAQAASRAQKQANQRVKAQSAQRARTQSATWAKQQAAARVRAQAAVNARRQSTARPYITTKPRPKPAIKAKPAPKPKPVAKPTTNIKPAAKPVAKSTTNTKPVAKPVTKPAVNNTTHVVKAGESPWSVSNKYGITMTQLFQWNNIKNKTIHPNQKLIVKKAATATQPASKPTVPATYTIKAGDSVWGIAEKYGLSVAKFVQWNNIKNNTIHPGQTMHLKDPKATPAKPTPATGVKDTTHIVKAGESPWSVSNQYGITMDQLFQWNSIKDKTIHPNQTVIVKKATTGTKPVSNPAPPTSDSNHKVSYGESLWYIASTYGVTVDTLRQLNGLKGDLIHPGQELKVKKGATTTPVANPLSDADTIRYTVLAGESVWLIAHKHGVSMDDLIKWNNIKNYTIHPGQTLRIQKIVPVPQKPSVTTTPKIEQKPAITTTPKVEQKPGVTTTPKVEQKPGVTTTPQVEQKPGITKTPGIDKTFSIEKSSSLNTNLLNGAKYSDKVKEQMKVGDHHSFPKEVDNYGGYGKVSTVVGGDGLTRTKVEISGSYNSKVGTFEYIIEPDGITVNHRLFIKGEK